jgi:hypothetical protein
MDLMGDVYKGIPYQLALELKEKYRLDTFIETGTLIGRTAKWASEHFASVYTIESDYHLYTIASGHICKQPNIQCFHGLSQVMLPRALRMFSGSALIWLDAHWSRDLGYSKYEGVICPVLEELKVLAADGRDHIILIDDYRLFGKTDGWPTAEEVHDTLTLMGRSVSYQTDVFVAVPNGTA